MRTSILCGVAAAMLVAATASVAAASAAPTTLAASDRACGTTAESWSSHPLTGTLYDYTSAPYHSLFSFRSDSRVDWGMNNVGAGVDSFMLGVDDAAGMVFVTRGPDRAPMYTPPVLTALQCDAEGHVIQAEAHVTLKMEDRQSMDLKTRPDAPLHL